MGNAAVDHNPPTASWQGIRIAPVAEAAWSAAHDERCSRLHRSAYCGTRSAPYGDKDPAGERLHPRCQAAGCLDLHHELMERMITQIRKGTARTPERTIQHTAYLSRVASTQLVELSRAARVKLGFPAKPTRDDGAAGRVTRALSEEARGQWLVALFRMLRAYPFRNHVTGQWPLNGFAEECGKVLGPPVPTAEEIKADINHVLRVARTILGNAWVHDNVILPLLSHTPTLELFECYPSEGTNTTETLMAWQLATTHRKLLAQGVASEDALRRAFKRIYGVVLREITPAINSAFEDLTLLSAMPR